MKPSLQYRIALSSAAGLAALAGGAAVLSIAALAWPREGSWPRLADTQRRLAASAYDARPADLPAGEAAARRLVSVAPADGSAWLTSAYADVAKGGPLGPDALADIERSYAVMPYDPDRESWRLRLLLEHWPDVPESLRRLALAELEAKGLQARPVVNEIRNPAGRLAAEMVVPAPLARR